MKIKKNTLIELLVVVAIIGVLSSILRPSLSKAREKARQALSLSNQRQVGIAAIFYMNDNKSYAPADSKIRGPIISINSFLVEAFGPVKPQSTLSATLHETMLVMDSYKDVRAAWTVGFQLSKLTGDTPQNSIARHSNQATVTSAGLSSRFFIFQTIPPPLP